MAVDAEFSITPSASVRTLGIQAAITVGCLSFGLLCAYYVVSFWSDVPYLDQWNTVPISGKWLSGTWHWADILTPAGGHRIIFDNAFTLLDTELTRHDPRAGMAAGLLLQGILVATLTLRYRAQLASPSMLDLLVWTSIFAMIFSLRNWENLLAPWAINNIACFVFFLSSLLCLEQRRSGWDLAALIFAVLASITFSNGVLVWPIGAGYLLLQKRRRGAILWASASVIFVIALSIGAAAFTKFTSHDPLVWAAMFLALFGTLFLLDKGIISGSTPAFPHLTWVWVATGGMILFALLLGLLPLLSRRTFVRCERFSLAIIAFGIGSCMMIVAGRSAFGVAQAFAPRYYCTVAIVVIGTGLLAIETRFDRTTRLLRLIAILLCSLSLAAQIVAIDAELKVGPNRKLSLDVWRKAIINYRTSTDAELANPHFKPNEIRQFAATLERYRLHPF